jgi:gamma-glutamyltranspeptidase/glutathione hydrolase
MVCSADRLASAAGVGMLERGGTAADAMVAAAAVMAVVSPQYCGMGGDLLAVVSPPEGPPVALLAAGRAGSGADPEGLRAEGHADMPLRGDVRTVTVPGAVDGWLALHQRFGRLPFTEVLAPAMQTAEAGFVASSHLFLASALVAGLPGTDELCPKGPLEEGQVVRLPRLAATLRALAEGGRSGFYEGPFGEALVALGGGEFGPEDLSRPAAVFAEPLSLEVFGHKVFTVPPPSQGYLTLAGLWLAERAGLPADPEDPAFPELLMVAAEAAGADRPAVLAEEADGEALVAPARLEAQLASLAGDGGPGRATGGVGADGDTTHLCAADGEGLGISLTQSNALDFGAHLVAGSTGVFLHNRGIGFCLTPGHPNEYRAGRRPAHTLSPALVLGGDGRLTHLIGTMGGDAQPQIIGQLLARLLHAGQDPATAMAAPRVVLHAPDSRPFRLWDAPRRQVAVEGHAPGQWSNRLAVRYPVTTLSPFDPVAVGHSQLIVRRGGQATPVLWGASDPRALSGAALGR